MLALIMTSQTATAALMTMFRRLLNKFVFFNKQVTENCCEPCDASLLEIPFKYVKQPWISLIHSLSLSLLFSFPHLLPLFPWAHLHVVGMLQFISFDINLLNLPTLFLRVHFCLNSPSNYILLHKFSQLSVSYTHLRAHET